MKMVVEKSVLEQALEALKNNAGEMRVEGAISILERALAQQAEPGKGCHKRRNDPCACSRKALLCDGFGPPQQAEPVEPVQEPVAWMYKGEPWFDGTSYHDKYEVTTDERLAKFKDKNARPLCFAL